MRIYRHITELTGQTPLVRINRLTRGTACTVAAKVEAFNPGHSVKDRIAAAMIDAAERQGDLRPGGTIVEGTSGNTGLGLALLATARGYKCIFTIPDKMAQEKINLLKAFGAEVIVCPTAVAPDDPRSYYSVAQRLHEEIPNSCYPNQYANPQNPRAHYQTTGPEIWNDTDGRITHFVCGMGTGGTISGVGRYLKERKPEVRIIGVDPIGSLYHPYFQTRRIPDASFFKTYKVEGIGEDILPATIDFDVIDQVEQVTDRESFNVARRLCRAEGIFTGGSGGSAMAAALRVARTLPAEALLVVLLPDTGERYLSKVFNDAWMKENQFLETEVRMSAAEVLARKQRRPDGLLTVSPATPLSEALRQIKAHEVSQLPVLRDGQVIGTLREDRLIDILLHTPNVNGAVVDEVMSEPLPILDSHAGLDEIFSMLNRNHASAVLIRLPDGTLDIITKYDLVQCLAG